MINLRENIIRFAALILLQIFIVKEITFGNFSLYMTPFIYILALITLPLAINKYLTLIISFATGLIIDIFMNSQGIHASACLLIMYIRPYLIQNKEEIEPSNMISYSSIGNLRFLYLISFLSFIHHLWVFSLESFSLYMIFQLIGRALFSTALALILMYLGLILFRKQKK